MTDLSKIPDREILARTLWGEARGEGRLGMHAVANVIMNRFAKPGWWSRDRGDNIPDDTIAAVCLDPHQFSCWNKNDPNREKLLSVTEDDASYRIAVELADMAVQGVLPDVTNGATHYHTKAIKPYWARAEKPIADIGHHLFYA